MSFVRYCLIAASWFAMSVWMPGSTLTVLLFLGVDGFDTQSEIATLDEYHEQFRCPVPAVYTQHNMRIYSCENVDGEVGRKANKRKETNKVKPTSKSSK